MWKFRSLKTWISEFFQILSFSKPNTENLKKTTFASPVADATVRVTTTSLDNDSTSGVPRALGARGQKQRSVPRVDGGGGPVRPPSMGGTRGQT